VNVLNLGIQSFLPGLRDSRTPFTTVDWKPPARGNAALAWTAARLLADSRIDGANAEAWKRMTSCRPVLIGIETARHCLPALASREKLLLHAGPPLTWARACGPVRGALVGAVLWEGWASTEVEAESLLADGTIALEPCHHHGAVGPMAGVVSPSMPLWIVADPHTGAKAHCNLNEGLGKVLRFGAYGPEVLDRYAFALLICKEFGLDASRFTALPTAALGQKAARPLDGGLKVAKAQARLRTRLRGPDEGLRAMRDAGAGVDPPRNMK